MIGLPFQQNGRRTVVQLSAHLQRNGILMNYLNFGVY